MQSVPTQRDADGNGERQVCAGEQESEEERRVQHLPQRRNALPSGVLSRPDNDVASRRFVVQIA